MDIGKRFRDARELRDMNQLEVAGALGISRQKVSALEAEARGVTHETIMKYCSALRIDARFFFDQLSDIKEADLDARGEDISLSAQERIERKVNQLWNSSRPARDIDPLAERLLANAALYDFVDKIKFWDAGMLGRLADIAYGYMAGKKESDDEKGERGTA